MHGKGRAGEGGVYTTLHPELEKKNYTTPLSPDLVVGVITQIPVN